MSQPPRQTSDPEEPGEDRRVRPITLRRFDSLIEQQFRAAEEAGAFENLPGAGKPLDLHDDDHVPEDERIGFRLLKSNGYAPSWIDLQKDIRADQARLEAWVTRIKQRWPALGPLERERLRGEYEQRLRDLNRQITNYNLTAPPAVGQLPLMQSML
jgi:DnaJ homolog subfamily C member 28